MQKIAGTGSANDQYATFRAWIQSTAFFVTACVQVGFAQVQPTAILQVALRNSVEYQHDIPDPARFATNPGPTPSAGFRNFVSVTLLGDVVSVNGTPVKGLYAGRTEVILASPMPNPGGAIADVTRVAMRHVVFEFASTEGAPIGTIMAFGFSGGPAPPGAPANERGNWAIVGGTGAFLGARGRVAGTGGAAGRTASVAEDPGNRRVNGGTDFTYIIHLIPMSGPQIVSDASGPAIAHSTDFTRVNAARPAERGEVLSLFAKGLGPTQPGVEEGQPFPSAGLASVAGPVEVTIGGKRAEVLAAVGYPGAVDGYQINFRVPSDAPSGSVSLEVSSAWIISTPVNIQIR